MKRDDLDFHAVPVHQEQMHARLENWAIYCNGSGGPQVSPMFRLYKPERETVYNAPEPKQECDFRDGMIVNQLVIRLPTAHRLSVQWCYIQKDRPTKAVKRIREATNGEFSLFDLSEAVIEARDMMAFVNAAA